MILREGVIGILTFSATVRSIRTTESSQLTALITGATGFIGNRLALRLIADGWNLTLLVRNIDRLHPKLKSSTRIIIGDLSDQEILTRAVQSVDVVFHCAANVKTWDAIEAYHNTNVVGTFNLLSAIKKNALDIKRFVHVSTMDVYGFPHQTCDEISPTQMSGYGYSDTKLSSEKVVKEFCLENQLPYCIIRPGNVIGPGSQFIQRICQELQSGIMLTIDNGQTHAGLVHVDTLVDDMVWAAKSQIAINRCYNIRESYDVSWNTVVCKLMFNIKGKGLIVNLPFKLAYKIAFVIEKLSIIIKPKREPFLHRLLVHIFGRTCGHRADSIKADRLLDGLPNKPIEFELAITQSAQWFKDQVQATQHQR